MYSPNKKHMIVNLNCSIFFIAPVYWLSILNTSINNYTVHTKLQLQTI